MKIVVALLSTASLLASCGTSDTNATQVVPDAGQGVPDAGQDASQDAAVPVGPHTYNGSASVGDFLTVTIDRAVSTIEWTNHTRAKTDKTTFTVDADGTLLVGDGTKEITRVYEIPGYALVAEDQHAKDGTQKALIFAFDKQPATKAILPNLNVNMLQFRTWGGGLEVGCGASDAAGNLTAEMYLPVNGLNTPPTSQYSKGTIPASVWNEDVGRGVMTGTLKAGEPVSTLFATKSGFLGLDAPGGSLFLFNQAPAGGFDAAHAGTYSFIGYEKKDESATAMKPGDTGFGTAAFLKATITLLPNGEYNIGGDTGMLVPFKNSPMQGVGRVTADCSGLFSLNKLGSDGVLGFIGDTLFLAKFSKLTDAADGGIAATYKYGYGVGLKKK